MGAWGYRAFDNDTACDWAYELEARRDLSLVEETLDRVLALGSEDVPSGHAEEALAAVEVIARLRGHPGVRNSYTETVDVWVGKHVRLVPSDALTAKAVAVIDRLLAPPSELLDAWNTDELRAQWRSEVLALRDRVQSAPVAVAGASGRPWWRFW